MHTKPHGHKSVFRRFGQLLLLLLCLFVVIAIFRLLLSLFPAQESNVQVTSPPDLTGLVEMQLSLSENEQLNAVNLTIDRIAIADTHRDFSDEDLVCLRELSLYSGLYQLTYAAVFAPAQPTGKEQTTPVGWRPVEYYQTPYPLENLCISPSNINDMFSYLGNNIVEISPSGAVTLVARSPEIDGWLSPIQVYETRSAFYYPYDNRSVFFGMTGVLEATKTLDEEGTTSFSSAPILSLNVTTPNWLTEIEILDQQLSSAGSDQRYFFINDNTEQGGLAFDSVPATMVYITQQRPFSTASTYRCSVSICFYLHWCTSICLGNGCIP